MAFCHLPVLPQEVLAFLSPQPGCLYVDGTLGGGGHSRLILEASAPDGRLIGFDKDREAIEAARQRLSGYGDRVTLVHADYADMNRHLRDLGIRAVDGLLLDLGVSSHQLDTAERGFSFQGDAPLDMRMNREEGDSAADLLEHSSEQELVDIIWRYGEERWSRKIARAIVAAREAGGIRRTGELAEIVQRAIPRRMQEERIHPATRTFQALRIAVNHELESLEHGLDQGIELLSPTGRIVVISFHSLEDRIVKEAFRSRIGKCTCPRDFPSCVCGHMATLKILTSKPVMADKAESANNPRARSAKLRAAEKLAASAA